jgi:hypothetical protein
MSALVILLIVALVPTQYFSFNIIGKGNIVPLPSDYAICYFGGRNYLDTSYYKSVYMGRSAWQYTIISALLLGCGMLIRIVRLHSTSSRFLCSMRAIASKCATKLLSEVYGRPNTKSPGVRLRLTLLYFPILSCFLMGRTLLDLWSSMAFEVFTLYSTMQKWWSFTNRLLRSGGF